MEILREERREFKSQLELTQKSKQTADKSCRHLEDRLAESVAKVFVVVVVATILLLLLFTTEQ